MRLVTLILVFSFFIFGFANAEEWRDPVTGMEFVKVPGGSFRMGCVAADPNCQENENPAHLVPVDGFWLGKHEVTQGQWKRIMGNNPSRFKRGDDYPVEQVSLKNVQEFIRKLNIKSTATFSLPSEAQWEYACRAGGKPVRFGTENGRISSGSANFYNYHDGTTPVGRYQANSLGLHDMSGNVLEWVRDKYTRYGNVEQDDPTQDRYGVFRSFRGGSWFDVPRSLRCSSRNCSVPSLRNHYLGFRLLRVK